MTLNRRAIAFACGMALMSSPATKARAFAPGEDKNGVVLEVAIDPRISDAADLATWIGDEITPLLTKLSGQDHQGTVRVGIAGALYDYEVTVIALQDNEPIGESNTWRCECSNEDIIARLREILPGLVDRLVIVKPLVRSMIAPGSAIPDRAEAPTEHRAKLGPVGTVGTVLLAIGLAASATGVVLAAFGEDRKRSNKPGGDIEIHDYRGPGAVAFASGTGIALTGLVMVLLRNNTRTRPLDLGVMTGRSVGFVITRRF
jgi:hypothetical protein